MSKIDDVIKKVQDLTKKYNPDQPRDPGGEGGGQWVPAAGDHSSDFTRDPSDGGWGDEKWGEQPKLKPTRAPRLITGKEFAEGNTVVGDTVDMALPEGSEGWKAQQRLKEYVNRPKPKASGVHPSGGNYRLDSYAQIYMDKMPAKQKFAAVIRSKAGARLKVASWHDSMSEVNAEVERLRSSGTHQAMATSVRTK